MLEGMLGFYLSSKGRSIDSIEDNAFEPVSTIRVGVAFSFLFSFFSTVERVLERPHDDNREWLTLHCDFNRGSPLLLYEPSIRFTSLGTEIRHLPTFPAFTSHFAIKNPNKRFFTQEEANLYAIFHYDVSLIYNYSRSSN